MIDPMIMMKNLENQDAYIEELRNKIYLLEKQLQFAAGVISTMPNWSDKHPDEVLNWLYNFGNK